MTNYCQINKILYGITIKFFIILHIFTYILIEGIHLLINALVKYFILKLSLKRS